MRVGTLVGFRVGDLLIGALVGFLVTGFLVVCNFLRLELAPSSASLIAGVSTVTFDVSPPDEVLSALSLLMTMRVTSACD